MMHAETLYKGEIMEWVMETMLKQVVRAQCRLDIWILSINLSTQAPNALSPFFKFNVIKVKSKDQLDVLLDVLLIIQLFNYWLSKYKEPSV